MRLPEIELLRRLEAQVRGSLYRGPRDRFATGAPAAQLAISAVATGWASELPLAGVISGSSNLFADPRVEWAIECLGGVSDARCVELGPLEGGHSYMLERAGAREVVAVEANKDAYLKCLIVKELFELRRCSFLCGEAAAYLRESRENFDICWCAGILYHMANPVELIELISVRASRLYIWTHYYEQSKLPPQGKGQPFAKHEVLESNQGGFHHRLHRHDYGVAPRLRGFWGGTLPYSNWLSLEDILGALEHFGWGGVRTQLEEHPHGPAVNLVAERRA